MPGQRPTRSTRLFEIEGLIPQVTFVPLKYIQTDEEKEWYRAQGEAFMREWSADEVLLRKNSGSRRLRHFEQRQMRMRQGAGYWGENLGAYVVLDSRALAAKCGTETDRKEKRSAALKQGKEHKAGGRHELARDAYIASIDVTPEMAFQVIKACKIRYVVSPYEADAQMAFLEKMHLVDGTLLWFKVTQEALFALRRPISLEKWSGSDFLHLAILAGCDYLTNIPQIGIKKAHALLVEYKKDIASVFQSLERQKRLPKYKHRFKLAELCFHHQQVFCVETESVVHLNNGGVQGLRERGTDQGGSSWCISFAMN
ncbi:PIN domain-like protein [Roridomyces roridus]|uniref:PIN domain-like protein n=1 Tax=Roridomyces roridus TaxID=1738132 RepID=A0AAD7AX12_9AGAR|nr:PIN domain-like protein [Roridomyces roridus]